MNKNITFIIALAIVVAAAGVSGFLLGKTKYTKQCPVSATTAATEENNNVSAPQIPETGSPPSPAASKAPAAAPTNQPTIARDGAYIVSYENNGFNPQGLAIPSGKTVRFINNSNKALFVYSSEQDPAHNLSQSQSMGKGKTYDFAFSSKGIWQFYNRNYPSHTGTIVTY